MLFIQWDILPVKLLIKPKPRLCSGEGEGVLCTDCLFTDLSGEKGEKQKGGEEKESKVQSYKHIWE